MHRNLYRSSLGLSEALYVLLYRHTHIIRVFICTQNHTLPKQLPGRPGVRVTVNPTHHERETCQVVLVAVS